MKDRAGFRTNKESMKYTMIIERNEMYCVDPGLELSITRILTNNFSIIITSIITSKFINSDKISENGRNIYE